MPGRTAWPVTYSALMRDSNGGVGPVGESDNPAGNGANGPSGSAAARRIVVAIATVAAAGMVFWACSRNGDSVVPGGDAAAVPPPTAASVPEPTDPAAEQSSVPATTVAAVVSQAAAATSTTAAPTLPLPLPAGGDESSERDAYYAAGRVLDVRIEIADDDWDSMRFQGRTIEDVEAEIEEHNFSQPFAGVYTWFSATVTVDGETRPMTGIRKKGFVGSQSTTKPSLKLRFDKHVDDQTLLGGMNRMTLNNNRQDPSMLGTCLTYRVFAAAGHPAPRCNYAVVTLNGEPLGLYTHVEEFKKPFRRRHFGNPDGNLYEGTISDFNDWLRGTFEKKNNEDEDDWSDVDAVVEALSDDTDAGIETLGEIVDLDSFVTFWALEMLVGHWDGYASHRNNFWFYRPPDGKFVFLPWGTDSTFGQFPESHDTDSSGTPKWKQTRGDIAVRLDDDPFWRAQLVVRAEELLADTWDVPAMLNTAAGMAELVQQHALPDEAELAAAYTGRVETFIRERGAQVRSHLRGHGAATADIVGDRQRFAVPFGGGSTGGD